MTKKKQDFICHLMHGHENLRPRDKNKGQEMIKMCTCAEMGPADIRFSALNNR